MQNQSKLNITVNKDRREVTMTRTFDAPRDLVFKVYTDPKLLPQWWGPEKYTTIVDKMDVKVGGSWRYIQRGPDGDEHAFNGIYREVVPSERLVYTFNYEPMPGYPMLEMVVLTEQNGKTTVTATDIFFTAEDLVGMFESGMESGANESFERFARLLQTIQQATR